tara:strand:- start:350 stop:490 length:141 start_codon:yes stop_codon:yes gene_type:complete
MPMNDPKKICEIFSRHDFQITRSAAGICTAQLAKACDFVLQFPMEK